MRRSSLIAVIVLSFGAHSQEKQEIIQQSVEFISEQLETEDIDLTNVVEVLNFRYDKPLNLNSATQEELQELMLLSDVQINDLIAHRRIFGKLISKYELQALRYWDMQTIQRVSPFIRVDDKLDQLHVGLKEAIKQGKFEAFFRYQRIPEHKSGYDDVPDSILNESNSYYHGNPDRYYSRLRFSYRTNLSIGVTAEKDPGEQFFNGAQRNGFDFYSAHAFYKGGKYVRSVALGDYQVQIGQGLSLWSGYAFGKTADVTNVKRSANSLRPYTSVDETRFLRGAAVELGYDDFALTMFGSYKQVDGALLNDTLRDEQELSITSITWSGLHRTNSEIAKKNTLNEIMAGGNLRYRKDGLQLGLAAVSQGYDREFVKDTLPYNQFDFRGQNTVALSGDYSYVFRNFHFFGEGSYVTHSNAWAHLHGLLFSMDRRASMSLIYRNYDRAYSTFYNAGFAEGSRTQNEEGLYAGIKLNLKRHFTINAYMDIFRFPWLRYQVDAPSLGHEWMIQPSYKPNRELEIYARVRQQVRQRNSRFSDGSVTGIEDVTQRNYRLNLSYKISDAIRLKSRVEYVTIDRLSKESEDGFMVSQDLIYNPKSLPVDVSVRYAMFDTDSYDTRIYTYENNALYVFSSPAYYYQGSRGYVLIRYTLLRKIDIWARYGTSVFANRQSIGSGAEEIAGSTRSDITVQVRIKL